MIHHEVVSRLVHGGFAAVASNDVLSKRDAGDVDYEMPTWGKAVVCSTIVVFMILISSLDYTLNRVVATLTMIESPTAEMTINTGKAFSDNDDEPDATLEKEPLLEQAPAITFVPTKPITSSIRRTLRHLKSQAGRLSRWRGLGLGVLHSVCFSAFNEAIRRLIPGDFSGLFSSVATVVILAGVHMAWTHQVISMPSSNRFYQRLPPMKAWKHLWAPAAVAAIVTKAAKYSIIGLAFALDFSPADSIATWNSYGYDKMVAVVAKALFLLIVAVHICLFIVLPAHVAYFRVEASMLPAEEDPIVPFDRTFGGKVVPAVAGGTSAIGFVDAWRSVNKEVRRRVIALQFKIFGVAVAIVFLIGMVIGGEMWAIMGDDFPKMISQAHL